MSMRCVSSLDCSLIFAWQAWGVAHRLLMPVFGPIRIRKVFLLYYNTILVDDYIRCFQA
jgi:hypothetical protein